MPGVETILLCHDLQSRIAAQLSLTINPAFCASLNVVYFPQLGYLCAVPLPEEYPNHDMERAAPSGWQFQFSTEVSVYYKSQEMRDLDEHLGDLHGFIVDRDVEIIQELLDKILSIEGVLINVGEILAELDCLLAFADAKRQCGRAYITMREEKSDETQTNGHDRTLSTAML